jgi:hypothetical protein
MNSTFQVTLLALAFLSPSCRSAKKEIADANREVTNRVATIYAEASAGETEAEALMSRADMPVDGKPIVKSMERRFSRIQKDSEIIKESAGQIDENLPKIQDKPMSWKLKGLLWAGSGAALFLAFAAFTKQSALGLAMSGFAWILGKLRRSK